MTILQVGSKKFTVRESAVIGANGCKKLWVNVDSWGKPQVGHGSHRRKS